MSGVLYTKPKQPYKAQHLPLSYVMLLFISEIADLGKPWCKGQSQGRICFSLGFGPSLNVSAYFSVSKQQIKAGEHQGLPPRNCGILSTKVIQKSSCFRCLRCKVWRFLYIFGQIATLQFAGKGKSTLGQHGRSGKLQQWSIHERNLIEIVWFVWWHTQLHQQLDRHFVRCKMHRKAIAIVTVFSARHLSGGMGAVETSSLPCRVGSLVCHPCPGRLVRTRGGLE